MSQYNRQIKRGLAGIEGLNFAYRLNTWGPKTGPAMIPANAFRGGYMPPAQGLSSPLTWMQGVLGIESPQDMVKDAQDDLSSALDPLTGAQVTVQTILTQAQKYDNVTDATIQAKAQAVEANASGLVGTYGNLQSAAQAIINQIQAAIGNPNTTKDDAQNIKDQVPPFAANVKTFMKAVDTLQSSLNDLIKAAASGPGAVQVLENAAVSSLSTLTWILGGGALVYFLAPTFLPRMISGIRKSRA